MKENLNVAQPCSPQNLENANFILLLQKDSVETYHFQLYFACVMLFFGNVLHDIAVMVFLNSLMLFSSMEVRIGKNCSQDDHLDNEWGIGTNAVLKTEDSFP